MSINHACISGNLTRDAEMRTTPSGTTTAKFTVAVNDRARNPQTQEWEDYPNFIDCTLFGKRAEALGPYLLKGVKVCIDGKLRWSSWTKDGGKRSKVEVIVNEIEMMPKYREEPYHEEPYQSEIPF